MKRILLALALIGNIAWAQTKSCCQMTITDQNTTLAMNDNFAQTHLVPAPYENPKHMGQMISFIADDGEANAYIVKSSGYSNNVLIIFHEWWGLNDYIKQEADEFAKNLENTDVYAIDLYDGKVATDVPTAQKFMSGLKQERASAIIKGLIAKIGPEKSIATLGWCLGGAWSLQAALLAEKQSVACVMYYGMPEADLDRLKKINCEVLGIFALEDKFINPETVMAFQANMEKVGKKLTVYNYKADHAFANPSNPKYNKDFTFEAKKQSLNFLKLRLK
jgi:carboxymethylenebutenolidase